MAKIIDIINNLVERNRVPATRVLNITKGLVGVTTDATISGLKALNETKAAGVVKSNTNKALDATAALIKHLEERGAQHTKEVEEKKVRMQSQSIKDTFDQLS